MGISIVIALFCGVALFLYGMTLMGDGLKAVAGSKLEMVLYKLSGTPFKGVLLGTGITAIIQSSSATSIMTVGFVNSGMMKVRQAIGIVMGAIIGTSVTGWIICLSDVGDSSSSWLSLLSTDTLTGLVAVAGIYLKMFCKQKTKQQVGNILMGFAILMTGMDAMSTSVSVLKEEPAFIKLLTSFKNPLVGILFGMLVTCVLQSASATIGILQALASTGAISFEIAFPIIMGIAIGAAVPVLLSALGTSVAGKRTAFVYLLIDVLGVIIIGSVFYAVNAAVHFEVMDNTMNKMYIASVNTLFRFATVLILFPFIGVLEKMVKFIFKDNPEDMEDNAEIDRLEDKFIAHPAIAIAQSKDAVSSMARKARKNMSRAFYLLYDYSDDKYKKIQDKEDVIDKYEDKLGTYIVKITSADLTQEQSREVMKMLHTIGDFERIGDHAVNISNCAKEIYDKKLNFSEKAQAELNVVISAVSAIVVTTIEAYVNNDLDKAHKVEPLDELIGDLCDELKIRHVKRLQSGECTLDHGFTFNDLLTNFERIGAHCSNIAVATIELSHDVYDTHEYLEKFKAENLNDYNKNFEEYSLQYKLEEV
ncbi:MAG: Na/Pi cotransporter family protein [Oscillospiraceae bacterium]|nr:Na/Pi cotransporter family protein [Oscillospiraceae bacterium]